MGPSRSSRALDDLLEGGGREADAIAKEFHRTVLWRYRKAKGKPDADGVALLERMSGGRVPANGWEDEGTRGKPKPRANSNHSANRKTA